MPIQIRQRYKPFTHTPGAQVTLPGKDQKFTIYPTTFHDGPVKGFTVLLDLENGSIVVFGKGFRHVIENPKKIHLEKISFGVHKKQEWDGIAKRCSVEEFLPLWYAMSQWYDVKTEPPKGSLLEKCFLANDKIELTKTLEQLFQTGFTNLFYPQTHDVGQRGFLPPVGEGDPTILFSFGREMIRSFFFKHEAGTFTFLPFVPKGIHCGRFLNIQEPGVKMDFEWTKHEPRRLSIEVEKEKEFIFSFPKEIRSFRIKGLNNRLENGQTISLKPGRYLFDQFKK